MNGGLRQTSRSILIREDEIDQPSLVRVVVVINTHSKYRIEYNRIALNSVNNSHRDTDHSFPYLLYHSLS